VCARKRKNKFPFKEMSKLWCLENNIRKGDYMKMIDILSALPEKQIEIGERYSIFYKGGFIYMENGFAGISH
jgi:hypothetical protein